MKARINLTKFPQGRPGYYAMMENEAQYNHVRDGVAEYERSKRVTHYLVPASVFERLLALDRSSDKMCGQWIIKNDGEHYSCSCCGVSTVYRNGEAILSNFCPECGADLREVEEFHEEDPNKPEEQKNDSIADESSGS